MKFRCPKCKEIVETLDAARTVEQTFDGKNYTNDRFKCVKFYCRSCFDLVAESEEEMMKLKLTD